MEDDWKTIDASMMFSGMIANRNISAPLDNNNNNNNGSFDPCDLMIKRKKQIDSEDNINNIPPDVIQHNRDDINALESFCKQYNIVGFNSKLPPRAALSMLKGKMGLVENAENKTMLYG